MKIDLDQLKALVEAGDTSALESHILSNLEKGDIKSAAEANKEVKSELDSTKDQHHQTALETWKKNNLQKLIDAKVSESNPTKTPEQLEIEKLRKEINDERKASNREKLKNHALTVATEKKLPKDVLDFLIVDHGETYEASQALTDENLSKFETAIRNYEKDVIDQKFKDNGRGFSGTGSGTSGKEGSKFGKELGAKNAVDKDLEKHRDSYFS